MVLGTGVFAPPGASAFDGRRRGFILGVSFGPGFTHVHSDFGSSTNDVTRGALALNFKIGHGLDSRSQLYFFQQMSVFRLGQVDDVYEDWFDRVDIGRLRGTGYFVLSPFVVPLLPYTVSHTNLGLGVSRYLKEEAPSLYFSGGIAFSVIADPLRNDILHAALAPGPGLTASVGYEFAPHLSTELQFMLGFGSTTNGDDRTATTALLTLSTLAY
jgi:hypothetical protein